MKPKPHYRLHCLGAEMWYLIRLQPGYFHTAWWSGYYDTSRGAIECARRADPAAMCKVVFQ